MFNIGQMILTIAALASVSLGGVVIHTYVKRTKHRNAIHRKSETLNRKKRNIIKNPQNTEKIDLNLGLDELLCHIQSGKYQIIDVVHAFQRKAVMANDAEELNFLLDVNDQAEKEAEVCTLSHADSLRGVPVSIKDYFRVAGCDSTYGNVELCGQESDIDSVLVQALRAHGAIPFVVTNMSQTGYSIESSNPVIGATRNPHNKQRTCGGSSGGEGAILAAGASIIGLGSDVGGSIRIPAHYCGVYGFKPGAQRCSHGGIRVLWPSQNFISVSCGPMARKFEDLVTMFKVLVSDEAHEVDLTNPPLRFNDFMYEKTEPMKIGIYTLLGEGQVHPIPAVERAVNLAKKSLTNAGHQFVELRIPNVDYAINLYLRCLFSDGGKGMVQEGIGSNPVDPTISLVMSIARAPIWLKKVVSYLVYPVNRKYSQVLHSMCGVDSVTDVWRLRNQITEYRESFLRFMKTHEIDGIICPVLPIVAPLLGTTGQFNDIIAYTAIYNLLDLPAGVVPVTKVTKMDIEQMRATYPRDTMIHRAVYKNQSLDDVEGLPVGVQCVSLIWRDETCLRMMRDLTNQLRHSKLI